MKRLLFIFYILIFSNVYAGEVDNFYAWEKDIKDSYQLFNTYLNAKVQETLEMVNEDEGSLSESACEEVALKIIDKLGTTWYLLYHSGDLNTDMELWAEKNPDIDRVPRFGKPMKTYYKQTIYAPRMKMFGVLPASIDVTINVGGIYFGTDKISHFLGSGYEYYNIYLRTKEKTDSENQAHFKAIKWGIDMENGLLGVGAVRVFSYSDLEANYQGLLMTIGLCRSESPNIIFDGSKWVLKKQIDFRDHVNPNWDETFNVSTYTNGRLKKVRKNINKISLCDKQDNPWVKGQLKRYAGMDENYLEKGFLDTSLSIRILALSQRYQFKKLPQDDFEKFAEKFHPGFNYHELKSFNEKLKLHNQELFTLKQLCMELSVF